MRESPKTIGNANIRRAEDALAVAQGLLKKAIREEQTECSHNDVAEDAEPCNNVRQFRRVCLDCGLATLGYSDWGLLGNSNRLAYKLDNRTVDKLVRNA